MKIFLLKVLLFCIPWLLPAQQGDRQQDTRADTRTEINIKGIIHDADKDTPLIAAHITFIDLRDTTKIYHSLTNQNGEFSLQLPRGRYIFIASYVGYQTLILEGEQAVRVSTGQDNLGVLYLKEGTQLEEVEIKGYRPAARLRGDTLDYDARAFKVNPDAMAEDLVKRMPGITVEDGKVTAQGEDVRRILVDGREFFGEDPSIALRNLPAEVIARVEVFDRMSDQSELTGFDDGVRSKTINIVTRLDTRSSQFGRLYSGYGGDGRYQIGLATNIFKDNSRISIIGMSNNINEQNFSREDIISLAGGAIRGGRGSGMGRGMGRMAQTDSPAGYVTDFRVSSRYGDNTTHALGLNYSDAWLNDRFKLSGSYFFNISDNFTDQFTDRQYFLDDLNSQFYVEDSESGSKNDNHRLNMRVTWDIDDQNSLIFVPRLTRQSNTANNYVTAMNLLAENNLLSMSETGYDADLSGYNYGSSLTYRYRFEKTGRTISSTLSTQFNNNKNLYYLDALTDYFAGEGDPDYGEDALSDYLKQESDAETVNNTLSSNITYTEPFGEKGLLQAGYYISRAANKTDRLTNSWDSLAESYKIFEADLSTRLNSNYLTQRGSLGYLHRGEKYNLTLEMAYQHALHTSEHEYPYTFNLQRNFLNVLPRIMLTYDIGRGKNMRILYRTSTSPPSVTLLQDIVDNSNPVLLTSGNPDLDHSYSHFFMSRYNTVNIERSTNFIAALFGNISRDYIGNSTLIARADTILENGYVLKKGSQFSHPVNLDGFINIRSHISYGFPLRRIKSNLSLNTGLGMVYTPGLLNGIKQISITYNSSGGFNLSSNISPNVDFSINYNANYNMVKNTLQPHLDNNFFSQTSGGRFSFIFLKHWVFRSDLSNIMYRGLGDDFNQDYFLWNMNLGRKLFKNNLGEITLSVFDLLDQNNNIARNVSDSYIEDLRTNQITRFFMLSFTYNLRNFSVQGD